MDSQEIKEKREEGYLTARVILELVGKPKEHITKTLKGYIKKIEEDERYILMDKTVKRPKKTEQSMYSVFAELQIMVKDLRTVFDFSMDYMPASIEVEHPEKITLDMHTASDIANDFVGKLHHVDLGVKGVAQKNRILSQSVGILIQNAILILLNLGAKSKKEIAQYIGVQEEQLPVFLKKLIEDKKITEKDGTYALKR
ncbi:MAG: hypothetical protein ACOCWQ_02375 [Nanoarchaeota archaeon]